MNRWIVSILFIFVLGGLLLLAGCVSQEPAANPVNPVTVKPTATQKQSVTAFDQFVKTHDTPEQAALYMKENFIYNESSKGSGRPNYAPNDLLANDGQGVDSDFANFFTQFLRQKGGCKTWTEIKSITFEVIPYDKSRPQGILAWENSRGVVFYHSNADGNNYYFDRKPPFLIFNIGDSTDSAVPEIEAQRLNAELFKGGLHYYNDICK